MGTTRPSSWTSVTCRSTARAPSPTAELTTLATYEASFGVRRVSLYTSPTADYGLADNGSVDPSVTPINATCTAAGRSVFVGANCDNPVNINAGFAYPGVADRRRHDPAARRRGRQRLRRDAHLLRRPRGAGAHLRAGLVLRLVPRAGLRSGRLGDARPVRRRAAHLRRSAGRRSLPQQRHLHGRRLPDHQRRPAGVRELGERDASPAAHRGLSIRLGVQWAGLAVDAGRSADGQGGRARVDLLLAQPHLGSHRSRRRSSYATRPRRVHAQRSVPARAGPDAVRDRQRRDARTSRARPTRTPCWPFTTRGSPRSSATPRSTGQNNPSPNAGISERVAADRPRDPAHPERALLQRLAAVRVDPRVRIAAIADSRRRLRDDHRHPERRLPAVHAERQQRSLDVPSGEHPRL